MTQEMGISAGCEERGRKERILIFCMPFLLALPQFVHGVSLPCFLLGLFMACDLECHITQGKMS